MPTIDITQPELIWPGKYDEAGNRVANRGLALPFQVVETIKEGRASRAVGHTSDLFAAKPSGQDEWRNKLIWGDKVQTCNLANKGGGVSLTHPQLLNTMSSIQPAVSLPANV
jgi:hypothetical protein